MWPPDRTDSGGLAGAESEDGRGGRGRSIRRGREGTGGSRPRPIPQRSGRWGRGGGTRVTAEGWTAPRRQVETRIARTKLPPSRQRAGCAQLRGEQPPAAAHPHAKSPQRLVPPRAHPWRLAREPLAPVEPRPRGQSLGPVLAAASPRLLPDKKKLSVARRPGGPAWVSRLDSPERLPELHLQDLDS